MTDWRFDPRRFGVALLCLAVAVGVPAFVAAAADAPGPATAADAPAPATAAAAGATAAETAAAVAATDVTEGVDWPAYRGARAGGVGEGFRTPLNWSVAAQRNIKWKVPIPGLGHSSPIVWGDRLFVTTAVRDSGEATLKPGLYGDIEPVKGGVVNRWVLYCLDKTTGKTLWQRTPTTGIPKIKRHPKSSHANSTPATDGKRVVAFFGSEGLYCYDVDGELLWEQDLGLLDSGYFRAPAAQWGFGSSPVIHDGLVIVQCDVQSNSFIAALDITDGSEVWRTPRDDVPTWSTPTVDVRPGRSQVIVNGYKHIGGYDLLTGKGLWKLTGGGDIPVPTPIVAGDLIYITSAHGGPAPIYAVRAAAAGDIGLAEGERANGHIAWSYRKGGNYMQTPLVYGKHLYLCTDGGVLSCLNATTGEQLYREKLGIRGGFTASPVAADGKIYLTAENGDVAVVNAGPQFGIAAVNDLGESCLSTPAISRGALFFRTRHHLIAVAE